MTRVHAGDGSLLAEYATQRRLYLPIQAIPKLVLNAFISAEDKNFYDHGGLDFQGIARAVVFMAQNYGIGPPSAGRLDHHAAGREELPAHQRGELRAQDQGSAARAEDRAHLFEGQDPRALSQRNLSRARRLRRRRRVAPLLRQVGARADTCRSRLPRGACRRRRTIIIRSVSASARSSGAITCSIAWSRTATSKPRKARRRRRIRSPSRRARPARTFSRRSISPKRCAAISTTATAKRSCTKAGCRSAPRSIRSCR